jgi:hypothetical protein
VTCMFALGPLGNVTNNDGLACLYAQPAWLASSCAASSGRGSGLQHCHSNGRACGELYPLLRSLAHAVQQLPMHSNALHDQDLGCRTTAHVQLGKALLVIPCLRNAAPSCEP